MSLEVNKIRENIIGVASHFTEEEIIAVVFDDLHNFAFNVGLLRVVCELVIDLPVS